MHLPYIAFKSAAYAKGDTRNTPATVPQLQSLTSALLLSRRPPPFPCQSHGNLPRVGRHNGTDTS